MVRYTTYFQRESVSLKKNDPLFIWGFPRSEVNTYFSMHNLRSASKRPWIRYWRPEGTRPWHYLTSPQLRKSSWKEPCLEIKTSSTGYYRQTQLQVCETNHSFENETTLHTNNKLLCRLFGLANLATLKEACFQGNENSKLTGYLLPSPFKLQNTSLYNQCINKTGIRYTQTTLSKVNILLVQRFIIRRR